MSLISVEDESFEGGTVGSWAGPATLANSTAQAFAGSHSLSVTATSSTWYANPASVPVTGGALYWVIAYMRAATIPRAMGLFVAWFDASFNWLGSPQSGSVTDSTSAWTPYTFSVQAPANAAWGAPGCRDNSSLLGIGEVHYIDAVRFDQPAYVPAAANAYLPAQWKIVTWDTEVYAGGGSGTPPAVGQRILAANVLTGTGASASIVKVWQPSTTPVPLG